MGLEIPGYKNGYMVVADAGCPPKFFKTKAEVDAYLMSDFSTDTPEYESLYAAARCVPSVIDMSMWRIVARGDMLSGFSGKQLCRLLSFCNGDAVLDFHNVKYVSPTFMEEVLSWWDNQKGNSTLQCIHAEPTIRKAISTAKKHIERDHK